MPDPAWPASPPEVNYLRLVGAGAGGTATTLASCAAWQALAASNEVAVATSSLSATVTATDFEGVGGAASATAVGGLNAALQLLAGWAQQKAPIAASAVSAYETAVSSMIPAEVSLANRSEQAANVALNPLVLGALTPVIVALDAAYFGEYWPHNAGVGIAYGTALSGLAAALSVPPPLAPAGASPAAPAIAAAAAAQSAGQAAAGEAVNQSVAQATTSIGQAAAVPAQAAGSMGQLSSAAGQPLQAVAGAAEPVMGMFNAPLGALAGLPLSGTGSFEDELGAGADLQLPVAPAVGPLAVGGVPGSPGVGAVGPMTGAGGAGIGGVPTAGITSYAKPANNFASDNSGRPVGLKPGLLSAAELSGPVTTTSPTGVPVLPAQPVAPTQQRGTDKDGTGHARVIVGPRGQRRPD